MSLINEALKRTRDATYQTASAPSDAAAYHVTDVAKSSSFGSGIGRTTMLVILSLVVVAVSLVGRRIASPFKTLENGLASTPAASAPKQQPPAVQQSRAAVVPPAPVLPKAVEEQPVVKVAQPSAPAVPEPPKLVLQGIISGEGGAREAMINGYNVHEGEEIEGAKVVTIESRSVKLLFGGHEVTLRLP